MKSTKLIFDKTSTSFNLKNLVQKENQFDIEIDSKCVCITGNRHSFHIAGRILPNDIEIIQISNNEINSINEVKKYIEQKNFKTIITVGGGKVSDVGKYIAYRLNLFLVLVPTVISNDGLISPISVLNEKGIYRSFKGKSPDFCLIFFQFYRDISDTYFKAAAGDTLSNITALNDWEISNKYTEEAIDSVAYCLSKSSYNTVFESKTINTQDDDYRIKIIESQILSGLAMQISGSSRPCSGSEHLFSHALDQLVLTKNLHGIQVGTIAPFCHYLQNNDPTELLKFNSIILNRSIKDVIPKKSFKEVLKVARIIRPDRFTVLDLYSDEEITKKFELFIRIDV